MRRFIPLLLLLVIANSCLSPTGKSGKNIITVSIWPQKYFLEMLAGSEYEINVMVPEGSSPAVYEPTPQQVKDLSQSAAYIAIGALGFEKAWMEKFKSANPDMHIINASRGVSLINEPTHGNHGVDPHYWMSPGACFQMAINMKEELVALNPEKATAYEKNLSEIKEHVSRIDFQVREMLSDLKQRHFLIYHPSLSYFARDHNLEQLSIEEHGKEPSLQHMQETIEKASELGLKNVMVQEQFNTESAKTIAGELGGRVILFNPLAYQWDREMISLADKILHYNEVNHEQEAD
jgi:zinc transport system substrate-binding protein